jgi:hypothetical protein
MPWWDGMPEERYWVEITDRTNLGADLVGPTVRRGRPFLLEL